MRRILQIIASLAFIASAVWFIRHPHYDSAISSLTSLGALIGLLIEQRIHGDKETDRQPLEKFKRLEIQMPALMAEMRKDLATCPLRREIVMLQRSWNYQAKGNELLYYTDDHPDLLSQLQILSNHGLAKDITYNNATRYLLSEDLARYLGA
jgi:hypothetical protein